MNYKQMAMAILIGFFCVFYGYIFYSKNYAPHVHKETQNDRIHRIYDKLWTETGVSTQYVPLMIDPAPVMNAYATTGGIVIYQGLIDFSKNDDEIALFLGHEISHVTSGDVDDKSMPSDNAYENWFNTSKEEARADKLGALYMMKAGYDICKARDAWLRWLKKDGDYIFADHPGLAYRYSQLNINCSDGL